MREGGRAQAESLLASADLEAVLLLLGDEYFLIVFVRNAKGASFSLYFHQILEVGTRGRIFLHVALHPIRVLLLPAESKACPLEGMRLEASIDAVCGFSIVFGVAVEAMSFGDAIHKDCLLESACALLVEDACMGDDLRSP